MSIEICTRCDRSVDTDFNVEDIVYTKDGDGICWNCMDARERSMMGDKLIDETGEVFNPEGVTQ